MNNRLKRPRAEELDTAGFCSEFATALKQADMENTTLYSFISGVHSPETTTDELVSSFAEINQALNFEVVLLQLAIQLGHKLTAEVIKKFSEHLNRYDGNAKLDNLLKAIVLDVVGALKNQANAREFIITLLKDMLEQNYLQGIVTTLNKTDSCYTEMITSEDSEYNESDHVYLYHALINILVREYDTAGHQNAAAIRLKSIESEKTRQAAIEILQKLECDDATITALIEQLVRQPFLVNVINSSYNVKLICAVHDATAKRALIEKILQSRHESLTKRQRLDLCPLEQRDAIFCQLETEMTPAEYLAFSIEGVSDAETVFQTIESNRHLITTGELAGDCCKAVVPDLQVEVLHLLLDTIKDEHYIVTALVGLENQIVLQYLAEMTPVWVADGKIKFSRFISNTAEFSDLEKLMIANLANLSSHRRKVVLNRLGEEYGNDYIIYALTLLPAENVDTYICEADSIFEDASKSSLKDLFRILSINHQKRSPIKEDVLNTLSSLSEYNDWADAMDIQRCELFTSSLNMLLKSLPEEIAIAIIHGMCKIIDTDYVRDFLQPLTHRRAFLKAKYQDIASNFTLSEILTICHRVIKAKDILSVYEGNFSYEDVETIESLIQKSSVAKKDVVQCVQRCYDIKKSASSNLVFTESMNVILKLFEKYSQKTFKGIVKEKFEDVVNQHGGFINALRRFPLTTRMSVLKYAPGVCPANDLHRLTNQNTFPLSVRNKGFNANSYFKLVLKRVSNKKADVYRAYLLAIYTIRSSVIFEYCRELKTLNRLAVRDFVNLANESHLRLRMIKALSQFITPSIYTDLIDSGMLFTSEQSLHALLGSRLCPKVMKLVKIDLCDIYLEKAELMEMPQATVYLTSGNVKPVKARQLGRMLAMLPVDQQGKTLKQYHELIKADADRQMIISCFQEDRQEQIKLLLDTIHQKHNDTPAKSGVLAIGFFRPAHTAAPDEQMLKGASPVSKKIRFSTDDNP